jgi:hypothetical protein
MKHRLTVRFLGAALLVLMIPALAAATGAEEILRWNELATRLAAKAKTDPLTESRWFAMMHVAIHDAVNAVEPRYQPWRAGLPRAAGASPEAAAAAAAHAVLIAWMPNERAAFDAALDEAAGAVADEAARTRGQATGRAAAAAVLAARRNDGAERQVAPAPGTRPGAYRPTPPDLTPAFMAQWGQIKPFALRAPSQFRPAPPPAVGSEVARRDLDEVRRVGAKDGTTRSAEQGEIARYWYENSTQGWNRIAREVAKVRALDLWDNARLFALANLAMADGFIGGFEAKYHYNYWRPATAIRENGDREWLSDLWTPPVPDHPSTHTVLGAAAATAIKRAIGTDFVTFSMTSGGEYPNITRKFWCLSQAAFENGCSRILAGLHFPSAVSAGYRQGEQIGEWVADHALQPLDGPVAEASR